MADNLIQQVLAFPYQAITASGTFPASPKDTLNLYGKGAILLLDVVSLSGGNITDLIIQAKMETSPNGLSQGATQYTTIYDFSALAISTTGLFSFLIYPTVADAQSWKGKINGVMPRTFNTQIVTGAGATGNCGVWCYFLP